MQSPAEEEGVLLCAVCLVNVHAVMSMCVCYEGKVCLKCYVTMRPLQKSLCPVCNSAVVQRQPFCLPSAEQHEKDHLMRLAVGKNVSRAKKNPTRRRLFPPMPDREPTQIPVRPARAPDEDEMAAAIEAQDDFQEYLELIW